MTMQLDQVIVSDVNRSPIVQVVTYLCLPTAILAFLTHACIKFYVFRQLRLESGFVLTSLVFCIAQSVAVILQTEHGFGKPLATLSDSDVQSNLKSEYAATILLFISLGFSKFAIVAFVHNLTPSKLHHKLNFGIGILSCLWMLCSVLIAAFQCHMPRPWDRTLDRCIDRFSWWNAVSVLNILTEVAILTLELGITAQLHIARKRKAAVMTIFGCRSLVLIAAAIQLAYFHRESKNPSMNRDVTLGYWRSTICSQIVQCLAIVTTCLPYTKLFMEGFESGLLRLDDLRRRGEYSTQEGSGRREYHLMDISRSTPEKSIQVSKSWAVRTEPAEEASSSSAFAPLPQHGDPVPKDNVSQKVSF